MTDQNEEDLMVMRCRTRGAGGFEVGLGIFVLLYKSIKYSKEIEKPDIH